MSSKGKKKGLGDAVARPQIGENLLAANIWDGPSGDTKPMQPTPALEEQVQSPVRKQTAAPRAGRPKAREEERAVVSKYFQLDENVVLRMQQFRLLNKAKYKSEALLVEAAITYFLDRHQ